MAKRKTRKRHFIAFYSDTTPNAAAPTHNKCVIKDVPAAVTDVSAGESFRGAQVEANTTTVFETFHVSGINEKMVIRHDDATYQINKLRDPEHAKREWVIECNVVNKNG